MNIKNIILDAKERRASDIHIVCGLPIKIRIDGSLEDYDENILTHDDCDDIARQLLGKAYDDILTHGEVDAADTVGENQRVRINVFRQQGHLSSAVRLLNDKIPVLDKLGLPEIVNTFPHYKNGIILVTGETGSGKSTTLAALLDQINHSKRKHIITLEDPVEYVYTPDLCIINQREIGQDTDSYASGLKAILREDPDVILIGEMRDLDTIETALTAAETGHLVFATLHTNSASDAVERIVNVFPASKQTQVRIQLSTTLRAVLSQQLLPRRSGLGRVLGYEIMVVNAAIRNLIREGKPAQIDSTIQTSATEGSVSMDNTLLRLVNNGDITADVAMDSCHDSDFLGPKLGIRRGGGSAAAGGMNSGIGIPRGTASSGMMGGAKPQKGLFR